MKDLEVLHVTPHLGGGVGTVVRAYLDYAFRNSPISHSIVSLDDLNSESKLFLSGLGCEWVDRAYWNKEAMQASIARADIVLVHWWNHPLLQSLLMNQDLPEARIIFWTHISGTPSPNNFCRFVIEYPDRLVFTTPLSFMVPEIQCLTQQQRDKIGCIWSTAGVERLGPYRHSHTKAVTRARNIIGYVGNLDYTKLNNQFLEACLDMKDTDAEFVVIGPLTQRFKMDYEKIADKINVNVTGYIPEARKFELMSGFNIFGYPLARHHYATCDQAIQEAMAVGAVPVVLNNPMESYMVEHGQTGLVARDMRQYGESLRLLMRDDTLRTRLSANAESYAVQEYSISGMAAKWDQEFSAILDFPKKIRSSLGRIRGKQLEPNQVFVESLGNHAGVFLAHRHATTVEDKRRSTAQLFCLQALQNWSSPTKSTATHYYSYFSEDQWLREWSALTLCSAT